LLDLAFLLDLVFNFDPDPPAPHGVATAPVPDVDPTPVPHVDPAPVPGVATAPVPDVDPTPVPDVDPAPVPGVAPAHADMPPQGEPQLGAST
jgi:hypothetical protein